MRKSASEILRSLENRTARLERQAQFERKAGKSITIEELLDLGIITEDQFMQAKQVEQMGGSNNLPKVGDILVAINNWNGIRASYYEVLQVSKSFKTITVQQLKSKAQGINSPAGGSVMPILNSYQGRPMKKKVRLLANGYSFKVDKYTGSATLWNGKPGPYEID